MRGGKFLILGATLVTACSAGHQLQVRALPDPAAKLRYGGGLLAEGRAQLALGSTGIALETFRKLQREQPNDPEVYAAIAACYQAMGRYDVESANYEAALAFAPKDRALLEALAISYQRQGRDAQAQEIYGELARAARPAPAAELRVSEINMARLSSVTVALPAARAAAPTNQPIKTVSTSAMAKVEASPAVAVMPLRPLQPQPAEISLKPKAFEQEVGRQSAPPVGPRLERLTTGEVALITTGQSLWAAPRQVRVASKRVQWSPLDRSEGRAPIRVLNAARSQGLAARTRQVLAANGWSSIQIGDAERVRTRSLVLYSADGEKVARQLAGQLHCATLRDDKRRNVVVLLGRDAVVNRRTPSRA